MVGHEPGVETKGMVAYLPDRMALPAYMRTADVMDFIRTFLRILMPRKQRACWQIWGLAPKIRLGP